MMRKKIYLLLALLLTVVQGMKAQNGILCTASDKGRVICTDGTIYDNVSAAQADGKTAVAKIIWVDESSKKGLALHLADDWYYNNIAGVERCNQRNSFQPVAGATWKMASKDEWDTMVNAAGGYQQLRDGFGSVGGENLSTQSYYSSSTAYGDNKYWLYNFHDDEGYTIRHGWTTSKTDKSGHLRPCLAFDVLTLYEIKNQNDWFTFCNLVNDGNTFSDKYVKLTDDISINDMVGISDANSFQGVFDGDGHTLTFNKGTAQSPFNEDYCAPFRHVKNAVIKDLQVNGQIYTSAMNAAGFVGESHGNLIITNCRSSVDINSSKGGDGTHGGFVATLSGENNTILIDGCVFDGSFVTTASTTNCGGFIGWPVYNKPTIKNSLIKPSSVAAGMLNNTFARWHTSYEPTITNCYYVATDNLPTDQGMQAYSTPFANEVCKQVTLNGITMYSAASTISGVEASYNLDNGIARVMPTFTDPYDASLTLGTDYTATLNGNAVNTFPLYISTIDNYTLTFTGKGNYTGTKTVNFTVTGTYGGIPISSETTTLNTGEYIVTEDVTINSRINISGNVKLILGEGTTLNAKKGIELSGSNSLTIDGTGTLIINGCDNEKSGIGARQVGTLTIDGGTINVNGGSRAAGIGGDYENTSGGTIIINGGVVNATGGYWAAGIGGGDCNYHFNWGVCGNIIINGGQVTAVAGEDAQGIGCGVNSYDAGTLTIGWTNLTDFVDCTTEMAQVSFVVGKIFFLEGTKTIATPSNFSGKKIVPFDAPVLRGDGSEESPYLISNDDEWIMFAYNVSNGTSYSGEFVKLNNDITVSEMVGSSETNSFQGTFLGDAIHTLTFTKGTSESPFNEENCAPFRHVKNATIQNLKVTGNIRTNQKLAAGLVARPYGTTTISNCHVSTVIYSSKNGDGAHGGIVAMPSGTLNINGCSYTGRLLTNNSTYNCSGFVGWYNNTTVSITNSLYAPSGSIPSGWSAINHENTFVRGGSPTITNCYFTETLGNAQGAQAYTVLPDNEICKVLTFSSITVYLTPVCAVSGVEDSYFLSESPSITPVVTFNENALTLGTDYTATLDGEDVATFPVSPDEMDTYTLILTGAGDYAGAKTFEFMLLPAPNEDITFTDANTYTLKTDVNVASATYTKTLGSDRVGKHQAWFVPFDYTIKAADLEKFTFYKIDMIAHSPDPSQDATDDIWVFLKKLDANDVLHANMPYVYKPKQAVDNYQFITQNAVLKTKNTGVVAKTETIEDIYYFYGTYEPTTATAQDPFYYMNTSGSLSLGNDGTVTVGAFRWIMRVKSKFGGNTTASYAPRRMFIYDGDGDMTGVMGVSYESSDQDQANDDNYWYTLDGRRLSDVPSQPGVYIHKGIKWVIR